MITRQYLECLFFCMSLVQASPHTTLVIGIKFYCKHLKRQEGNPVVPALLSKENDPQTSYHTSDHSKKSYSKIGGVLFV